MCLVMYSMLTGSSTVRRWDWHSTRALSIRIRPSAVRPGRQWSSSTACQSRRPGSHEWDPIHPPANATQTWSSSNATLRTVRGSCSCSADFFSTPRTTTLAPRTPTCEAAGGRVSAPDRRGHAVRGDALHRFPAAQPREHSRPRAKRDISYQGALEILLARATHLKQLKGEGAVTAVPLQSVSHRCSRPRQAYVAVRREDRQRCTFVASQPLLVREAQWQSTTLDTHLDHSFWTWW